MGDLFLSSGSGTNLLPAKTQSWVKAFIDLVSRTQFCAGTVIFLPSFSYIRVMRITEPVAALYSGRKVTGEPGSPFASIRALCKSRASISAKRTDSCSLVPFLQRNCSKGPMVLQTSALTQTFRVSPSTSKRMFGPTGTFLPSTFLASLERAT